MRDPRGARRVVYTCLFGGYEKLLDQPVAAASDIEFIAFTDDPDVTSDSWRVQLVEAPFPVDQNRSSRRPKILAHEYLPEFDESLYVDNTVLLTVPPHTVFDALLPVDVPLAVVAHSHRGAVRDEFTAVVQKGRDIDLICDEQRAHYEQVASGVLDLPTIWAAILLRRHHDPALRSAMQTWWEHVLRYSRRDQLSLPFVLARSGLPHRVHALDNWVSDYHVWPRDGVGRDPSGGAPADIATGLRADVAAARAAAQQASADLTEARRQLAAAEAAAAETRITAQRLLTAQRNRAATAETRLAAVHDSTSWRITRPLRALTTKVRRANAARRSGASSPR